jgi:integrase
MANTKMPSPQKYRGKWRAQVTLKNGQRPAKTFETYREAKQHISDMLSECNTEHEPRLGGPTRATLADALTYYAGLYTLNKGGARAELNRINHYREGAGLQRVAIKLDSKGAKVLQESPRKRGPSAFEQHADERRDKRSATYQRIAKFAGKMCSTLSKVDIRELMADMEREGLSPSTIQKEIALLRHMFNMAAKEWNWLGFKNPAEGIKLGKSATRFVFLTKVQEAALWKALSECDNPYVEHWVALALETTLRPGSVNALRWDQIDLDNRVAFTPSKSGPVPVALSQSAVKILNNMPHSPCGKVFPMSTNAMDMAWDGARIKAGLPKLRLADLRHLSATGYARRGLTAPQLQKMLGHKTMTMAQVYINLVQNDMLDVLDLVEPTSSVYSIAPLEGQDAATVQRRRRSNRLAEAVAKKLLGKEPMPQAATRMPAEGNQFTTETNEQASPAMALEAALSLDEPSEARPASTMAMEEPPPDDDSVRATGTDAAHPTAPRATGQVIYAQFGKRR